nr:glycoside hydrolase family protein [uncultured Brevundimonas sp.]
MSDVVQKPVKVSREGVILIKSFEGFRPRAVRRNDGRWMIGYGHTQSAREGLTISESDAELLLQHDLIPVVSAVKAIQTPLNQHQFDSIASFAFSVGVDRFKTSDVLARLNAGAVADAGDAMTAWADDAAAEGPPRRRAAERALFFAKPGLPVALADLLAAPVPHLPHEVRFDATPAPLVSTPLALSSDTPEAAPFPLDEAAPESPASTPTLAASDQEIAPFPLDPDAPKPTPVVEEAVASLTDASPPAAILISDPPQSSTAAFHLYSPFGAKIVGPLPTFEQPSGVLAGAMPATPLSDAGQQGLAATSLIAANDATHVVHEIATELSGTVADTAHAITTPVESTADATADVRANFQSPGPNQASILASPIDSLDRPALALTAPDEAETAGRAQTPQFDRTPSETHHTVLERPYDPRVALRRRSGWSETWTFLAMGTLGLIAFGAAIAAFRRASAAGTGDSNTIGWVLALIALACIAVAGWNLYQRWGRGERR